MVKALWIVLAALFAVGVVVVLLSGGGHSGWPVSGGAYKPAVQGNLYNSFDLSPDGNTIVFDAATGDSKCLYLLHLPTQTVTQFTALPDYCAYPAFSPDGKRVVYERARDLNSPRYLFIRSADGTHDRQLTRDTMTSDEYPFFSRDGKRVVFSRASSFRAGSRSENAWNSYDVYVVNADGSNLQHMTQMNSGGVIRPRFSPDGKTIVFEQTISTDKDDQMWLCQINADGSGTIREVVRLGWAAFDPRFLPDGRQIVFVSNSGGCDLWRVSLDGGKPVRITDTGSSWGNPCLTPDGKSVVFRGGVFPNIGIHQIDLDGTHPRILAGQSLTDDPLHWKP